jgi:hypothetical protein
MPLLYYLVISELTVRFHFVQSVTNAIVQKLHRLPLALANIGVSISRSQALDPAYWNKIEEDPQSYLELNSLYNARPILYDMQYSLSLRSSMMVMVMVKLIRQEVLPLLGLIALLNDPWLSEDLVKLLYKRISQSQAQFAANLKYLEARSLLEIWGQEGHDEFLVSMD